MKDDRGKKVVNWGGFRCRGAGGSQDLSGWALASFVGACQVLFYNYMDFCQSDRVCIYTTDNSQLIYLSNAVLI